MGRWGHRLFEGDRDLDLAIELSKTSGVELSRLVFQTDMLAPAEAKEHYKTPEYQHVLAGHCAEARSRLDSGVGAKTWKKLCVKASASAHSAATSQGDSIKAFNEDYLKLEDTYKVILFGALLMRAGAKLTQEMRNRLLDLLPCIPCHDQFMMPMADLGFRLPGMLQFKAALEYYTSGTPRSFVEPSCFHCGKISSDSPGHLKLIVCGGNCDECWFCNDECKKADQEVHQKICRQTRSPALRVMALNV